MKTIRNPHETRFLKKTINFGECFSPYAIEEIALLKRYNRNGGTLDTKTMWKSIEEDCARYVVKGEMAEDPKSPWDIKIKNQNGKAEFYEVRSTLFSAYTASINFASSTNHIANKGRASRMALEEKWLQIDGYLICDSGEYSTKGFFRWWKIPVGIIKELYVENLWAATPRRGGQLRKVSQWCVHRQPRCFTRTMNELFNEEKTQIYF